MVFIEKRVSVRARTFIIKGNVWLEQASGIYFGKGILNKKMLEVWEAVIINVDEARGVFHINYNFKGHVQSVVQMCRRGPQIKHCPTLKYFELCTMNLLFLLIYQDIAKQNSV